VRAREEFIENICHLLEIAAILDKTVADLSGG
jgi:translation initiation factor RLI1